MLIRPNCESLIKGIEVTGFDKGLRSKGEGDRGGVRGIAQGLEQYRRLKR